MAADLDTTPAKRARRALPAHLRWPVGFAIAAFAVFLVYYYLSYFSPGFQEFLQRWLPLISVNEMLVWMICALGLNIVVGYAGLLDLGFVAFWAIGGYVAGWCMSTFFQQFKIHILGSEAASQRGIHVSFWFVLILAAAVCAIIGMAIGAPTLRLRSDYLALVTLGFGEIIPQVFTNGEDIFGVNVTNGTKGITPVDRISIGSLRLGPFDLVYKYLIFIGLAALMVFISLRLRSGKLGRAWLAIREDEVAASAMGVPLMRTKLLAYGIGAVAGGIGGVAFATHVNGVLPDRFNFTISITLLAMVVLGGMGNVWGVTLGALMLAWVNSVGLEEFGRTLNDVTGRDLKVPSYNYLLFDGVLVLMMLFRREGMLPESRTRLVLHEQEKTGVSQAGIELDELDAETAEGTESAIVAGAAEHPVEQR